MSNLVNIKSTAEWQSLLSGTTVVIADFYADWCGPCKMIAPHFERLSKEYARPKKVAFAKVDVDSQSDISRAQGVSAMPTFKIFHNGSCVDTIKGANPPALAEAVSKAVKLAGAGGASGNAYITPGRTLGSSGPATSRGWPGAGLNLRAWNFGAIFKLIISFVGLYLVSFFSFDARGAAEASIFNVHRKPPPPKRTTPGSAPGSARPPQKPAFKTMADLG
ncbi:hypothetical protein HIM_08072 [Hirsutella minnesotensis 3608]|uniref:Thioredoxin domain-containing protein n=1 Tax=Hirsutella minnesotensis 3608 TaxID=1043627 RepID=A0A0F7ZT60_9HYPO|nr:hypothetical protein HIM_08072 [Hirsutella minnesotensis 3608]